MFYFYFVIGRSKPYLIDMNAWAGDTPEAHPRSIFPDWPGIFVKMEVGNSNSQNSTAKPLTFTFPNRTIRQHTIARKQLPDCLVAGVPRQGNQRPLRRLRSRSAQQLRASTIPAPSASINGPFSQPVYPISQSQTRQHPDPQSRRRLIFDDSTQSWRDHEEPPAVTYQAFVPGRPHLVRQRTVSASPATRQSAIDRKPLPPLPSRFRLGEDDLPWQNGTDVPAWLPPDSEADLTPRSVYTEPASINVSSPTAGSPSLSGIVSPASTFAQPVGASHIISPPSSYRAYTNQPSLTRPASDHSFTLSQDDVITPASISALGVANRVDNEDPSRARDRAMLQSAMLTIDSLVIGNDRGSRYNHSYDDDDDWDVRDQVQMSHSENATPTRPSLGWAVRVEPDYTFLEGRQRQRESNIDQSANLQRHTPAEYSQTRFHAADWVPDDFGASYYGADPWGNAFGGPTEDVYGQSDWYWDGGAWRRGVSGMGNGLGRRRSMMG